MNTNTHYLHSALTTSLPTLNIRYHLVLMANRRGARECAGKSPLSKEILAQAIPPRQALPRDDTTVMNLPSSVKAKAQTYVPTPPSGDADSFLRYVAKLSIEKRETIYQFVEATKEPSSAAVQTLQECEWDLLGAISRFAGDDDEDGGDAQKFLEKKTIAPLIALTRSRHGSDVRAWRSKEARKQSHLCGVSRGAILQKLVSQNGHEWPRNPRNAAYAPIALQYLPSSPNTHIVPEFSSPYGDRKLWYTGFMGP